MTVPTVPAGRRELVTRFDAHEWSVLLPLCLVGFFANYDTGLLSLAGPSIAAGLDVSVATFGIGVAVIRLAALGGIPALRLADRWGRRPLLLLTALAFTLVTGATATASGLIAFVALQMLARLLLVSEETLAGVVLSEELRPDRRGAGIGMLGIISTAGFGLVALLLLVIDHTRLGWRLFYVAALVPLLVVLYLRRNLKETRAYVARVPIPRTGASWRLGLEPEQRRELVRLLAVFGLVGMLATPAFFYAADLAQTTYGWKGLFTAIVFAAAPTTVLGYVAGGRLSDRLGRKPVMIWSVVAFSAGAALVFSGQRELYVPGFFLLAGGDAAISAVRSVFVSELFPTEVRATLASVVAGVNVAAGSLGLVVVGGLSAWLYPPFALLCLAAATAGGSLLLRRLPETAGVDLVRPDAPRDPAVACPMPSAGWRSAVSRTSPTATASPDRPPSS